MLKRKMKNLGRASNLTKKLKLHNKAQLIQDNLEC